MKGRMVKIVLAAALVVILTPAIFKIFEILEAEDKGGVP